MKKIFFKKILCNLIIHLNEKYTVIWVNYVTRILNVPKMAHTHKKTR